jgi:hypothetical protein
VFLCERSNSFCCRLEHEGPHPTDRRTPFSSRPNSAVPCRNREERALENNKGTITPKHPVKPCMKTEEKAKRANKIAFPG